MSESEQDAVVGRLVREKITVTARKAALDAEIRMISDNLSKLAKRLDLFPPPSEITNLTAPIKKYLDESALNSILEERQEASEQLRQKISALIGLGIPQ